MILNVASLVVACAALAQAVPRPPPPYNEALDNYRQARGLLQANVLSNPDRDIPLDEIKRHYLVISDFIGNFALLISSSCDQSIYHSAYQQVLEERIPYSIRNYKEVIRTAIRFVNETEEHINDIVQLIDAICVEVTPTICDSQIDSIVDLNKEVYAEQAHTLIALSVASKNYVNISATINSYAYNNVAVGFLLTMEYFLKPLITSLAAVFSHIRQLPTCV